ncbi:putative DNA-binding protein [Sulfolobus polyhedral virus 1]|uniref:Putative DNA-binding protein n=1 Tax=Sulfolobus polyhedral virus 1 TaxID=1982658 RepID=A0A1W6I139_SPV1|nr:putative DNA-binding protein [Sulfolobus polyhedral virus 1]ARM37784.1 putative DNA-binding protein [Sulfolobus polyhedral virus 1]
MPKAKNKDETETEANEEKKIVCDVCGLEFSNKQALRAHKKKHANEKKQMTEPMVTGAGNMTVTPNPIQTPQTPYVQQSFNDPPPPPPPPPSQNNLGFLAALLGEFLNSELAKNLFGGGKKDDGTQMLIQMAFQSLQSDMETVRELKKQLTLGTGKAYSEGLKEYLKIIGKAKGSKDAEKIINNAPDEIKDILKLYYKNLKLEKKLRKIESLLGQMGEEKVNKREMTNNKDEGFL